MFEFLNRLAWMVSFVFGFFVVSALSGFLNFFAPFFFRSSSFFHLIFILLFAFAIKKIFLGKNLIEKSLKNWKPEQKPEAFISEVKKTEENLPLENEEIDVEQNRQSGGEVGSIYDLIKSVKKDYNTESLSKEEKAADKPVATMPKSETKAEKKIEEVAHISKPLEPNFFQKFFQENVLAKIGGIMLFLAVLFLLQLVYTRIGPVGKLLIGFLVGFMVFVIGLYLEKKKYQKESRVMFGTAILINYLVILSGRYLIGDGLLAGQNILSEVMTFFLLILNTVFAVSVALVYHSQFLLFMAFAAAYLNPFLIGAKAQTEPYTLVFYALIVSLGAIFLSVFYKKENFRYSESMLTIALIGGNALILLAPFSVQYHWVFKLGAMALLSLTTIIVAYKNKQNELIGKYFLILYAFFIALIFYGTSILGEAFSGFLPAIAGLIFLLSVLLSGVFVFTFVSASSWFLAFILFPLGLILLLFNIEFFGLDGLGFILMGALFVYLMVFVSIFRHLSALMAQIFFAVLGFFVFFISFFLNGFLQEGSNLLSGGLIYNTQAYSIMISGLIFLLFAYYFSGKKKLEYLYSIATFAGIISLLPVLTRSGDLRTASIASIILLFAANIALPFIHKNLLENRIYNLLFGIIAGALFAVGELFYFWYGDVNQSKITLGLSFAGLAALYFFLSYFIALKIKQVKIVEVSSQLGEQAPKKEISPDAIYAFLGISISIFSLAIAYIFSTRSEIVAAVWIFEAVLMFFFYRRTKELKIYFFGIILGFIGLVKYSSLMLTLKSGDYVFLIPLLIVLVFFAAALKFLDFENGGLRWAHDIFHVVGLVLSWSILLAIIPDHRYGWAILGMAVFILLLSIIYGRFYSGKIKYLFAFALFLFSYHHVSELGNIFHRLDRDGLPVLKIFQVSATIIFAGAIALLTRLLNRYNLWKDDLYLKLAFSGIMALYLFAMSSLYVFYFFAENSFIVTIYWGILSLLFLGYGIEKNYIKFRTVGLYILSLTTLKILIYDIWSGLDNAVMRVVALMVVGSVMIGVSVFYSKKYGSNLKGEFELKNLR